VISSKGWVKKPKPNLKLGWKRVDSGELEKGIYDLGNCSNPCKKKSRGRRPKFEKEKKKKDIRI